MFTIVFAMTLVAAPVPPDDANVKALKALQGKWKAVAAEQKGFAFNVADFDLQTINVNGTLLALSVDLNKETIRYEIKLDLSKEPAHINLIWLDEKGKPTNRVAHGIYKLDGGRLMICFGQNITPDEPEDRPSEFKTGPPEQRPPKGKLMYTFERVKE
jgi:uncharacterized protein (TIGR03067 family)